MKKILYIFVFATLMIVMTPIVKASDDVYYRNNENIRMTEEEYHNLLNLGFTEKQIERMDYDTFISNKDIEGHIVSETKQYYKVTTEMRNGIERSTSELLSKEEYERQLQEAPQTRTSGNYYACAVTVSYRTVTTRIMYEADYLMRYKVDVDWHIIPSNRSYDIIGIGIEADKVEIASSLAFRQDFTYTSGSSSFSMAGYKRSNSTGGSVLFELPTGSLSNLSSFLYFSVIKTDNAGTVTELIATGDYTHSTSSISKSTAENYTCNYATGVYVYTPYDLYFDGTTPASARFLGTW